MCVKLPHHGFHDLGMLRREGSVDLGIICDQETYTQRLLHMVLAGIRQHASQNVHGELVLE